VRLLVDISRRVRVHIDAAHLLPEASAEAASLMWIGDCPSEFHVSVPHIARTHVVLLSSAIPDGSMKNEVVVGTGLERKR
jgi:hypothetical protein